MRQIENTTYFAAPCGAIINMKWGSPRHLKLKSAGAGYAAVTLRIAGKSEPRYVHRVVADAFLDAVAGKTVDHANFDKRDNCVWNLEVVTHAENMKRAFAAGRIPAPPRNGFVPDWRLRPRDPATGQFS